MFNIPLFVIELKDAELNDAELNDALPTWLNTPLFVIPENIAEFAVKGEFTTQLEQLKLNGPWPGVV